MSALEVAGGVVAGVQTLGGGWLIKRLWRDLRDVQKRLKDETDARIKASAECDERVEASIASERKRADEFEAKFTGATARMQARIDALEARNDSYVEKRVEEQAQTAKYLGEISDKSADALDHVANSVSLLRTDLAALREELVLAMKGLAAVVRVQGADRAAG